MKFDGWMDGWMLCSSLRLPDRMEGWSVLRWKGRAGGSNISRGKGYVSLQMLGNHNDVCSWRIA